MFNKLFNRSKATSPTPTPAPPEPIAVVPTENRLEAFREEWDTQWEASHEVIEGNGGNTDWAAWTDVVEREEEYFAPTVPMPLSPK